MLQWLTSGCKNDIVAVKLDSDLSLHARCGCTSAWFKRSFVMNVSLQHQLHVTSTYFMLIVVNHVSSLGELQSCPTPLPPFGRLQLT